MCEPMSGEDRGYGLTSEKKKTPAPAAITRFINNFLVPLVALYSEQHTVRFRLNSDYSDASVTIVVGNVTICVTKGLYDENDYRVFVINTQQQFRKTDFIDDDEIFATISTLVNIYTSPPSK
jgi:hypothetical protein